MNPLLEALLGTLGYVGSSLDKPGATVRGLLGGQGASALANLIPFSDTMGITDPEQRMTGRGLLEHYGALDHKNPDDGFGFGDILGMGVDAATDPLQWGGLAKLGSMMRGNRAARVSNELGIRNTMHNLDAQELVSKGAMPPEVAALTKVRDEAGPVATYHGTPNAFEQYDAARMDPEALHGPGVYAATNPELANHHANERAVDSLRLGVAPENENDAIQRLKASGYLDVSQSAYPQPGGERGELGRLLEQAARPRDQRVHGYPSREKLGKVIGDLLEIDETLAPRNVRKQFLDIRNPFDIDKSFSGDEYNRMMQGLLDGGWRQGVPADARMSGTEVYHQLGTLGRRNSPGVDFDQVPVPLQELLAARSGQKELANKLLRSSGYDGILDTGGNILGGGSRSHPNYVAFDPSQVYQPLVAPALKHVPPHMDERSLSPLLAALAGENALSRTYPQGA